MKHRQTLFSLPLFCAFALSLSAQSVTGTWISRVSNNDGTFRETIYRLEQNGEALTGAIVINYRPNTISEGSIQNGHFHFVMGSGNRRRTVDGTIKGEELSLDLAGIDGRPAEHVVATRTTADAGTPPPPLPVPALHDVPDNGLARTPPMGWNSWNHFSRKIDDTTVRRIADAMVSSGLKKVGYIYVNIDDTWQGSRDAAGNLQPNTKFPDMKALADYVHSKGLKLGIYSGLGPTTCAAYAGSFGHEEQDA